MSDEEEELFKAYREDKRIPCRYGAKCYQKNAVHHEKYKHLPSKDGKKQKPTKRATVNKKRKKRDDARATNDSPKRKAQKRDDKDEEEEETSAKGSPSDATTASENIGNEESGRTAEESNSSDHAEDLEDSEDSVTVASLLEGKIAAEKNEILASDAEIIISHLFLTEMPEDFFHLYEFCKSICEKNPLDAFKGVGLQLVGPYDVFREGFLNAKVKDKESMLRHWRYFYDPPEFQTIAKENSKDGLHFGYWRDDISEKPAFVAKNKAAVTCVIKPVAENIFGALDGHIGEKLKLASPFEKTRIAQLQQKLKHFAKEREISLEKKGGSMQSREKKVLARTLHKAGIVVPYDKKTQLGYRDLAVTDGELEKILKQIDRPLVPEARKKPMSELEEVIRLATIAADECDFGTPLELGHDLFSSGVSCVQTKALNLLSLAYNLLRRPELSKIAQAHLKNRRRSLEPSVLRFD